MTKESVLKHISEKQENTKEEIVLKFMLAIISSGSDYSVSRHITEYDIRERAVRLAEAYLSKTNPS